MNYEHPELLKKLAGGYVLGTMAARARPRFARLLAESPQAQRAVAEWHNELAPLAATMPPLQPPEHIWQAIAARTAPAAQQASAHRCGLRSWFDGWGRAAAGFALGVVLTTGLVSQNAHLFGMHHMDAALPASYFGILSDASGAAVLTAGSHRRGATIKIKLLKPLAVPAGSVARLWALPEVGTPLAIANVPAAGAVVLDLGAPAEELFARTSRLGVSFEADPAAGSPTMPFVLLGHCVKFW